jgi:hypothetical protein
VSRLVDDGHVAATRTGRVLDTRMELAIGRRRPRPPDLRVGQRSRISPAVPCRGWCTPAGMRSQPSMRAYSRVSNAISELELTGSPSKWVLDPWQGIVYTALVIAFGIGVWRSAYDKRALRVVGGLQILAGAAAPLWMLFGEASLAAHLILSVIGISTMLGSMAFSAVPFRSWFRLYSSSG